METGAGQCGDHVDWMVGVIGGGTDSLRASIRES